MVTYGYQDGEFLASATDSRLYGGGIGLHVHAYDHPNADVRFDNVAIRSLDCAPGGLTAPWNVVRYGTEAKVTLETLP
jgi:hypothetical protein